MIVRSFLHKILLTPLSWLYQLGVRVRHYLYDHRWLSKKYAPLPVISIGNVVAGGAGKTQVALLLAKELNIPLAILSRGYRGEAASAKMPLVVDVKTHSAKRCGDEPYLLADRITKGVVIVNKDRFKSALEAQRLRLQLIVLDDGMQHRKLHRDFEIVVIDAHHPFGGEKFLPRGRLREDLRQLKRADLIFFIGSPEQEVEKRVAYFTKAPKVVAQIAISQTRRLDGTPIESINKEYIGLFCGIGNPKRFENTVKQAGAKVVATLFTPDHRLADERALIKFATLCQQKGAKFLLCTEKDKVKLTQIKTVHLPLPIAWVQVNLEIIENREIWNKTVAQMKQLAAGSIL